MKCKLCGTEASDRKGKIFCSTKCTQRYNMVKHIKRMNCNDDRYELWLKIKKGKQDG